MSWYKMLKFAANPKSMINNMKITDPFLKFFIYTYEPAIDASVVKNEEQLVAFIKESLISDLKKKTHRANPDSYYKKSMSREEIVNELNEHADDPRFAGLSQRILTNDTAYKSAEKTLLDAINSDKQKSFDKWWKFMSQDYSDNPAFFYSILNPMFEKSPAERKNPVPPAHREAIAMIADEIGTKGVNQMNVAKKFSKLSFQLDKDSSPSIDLDNEGDQIDKSKEKYQNASDEEIQQVQKNSKKCWIRIDSGIRDKKGFTPNQEKLMRQSTDAGWCVAQTSYSEDYLNKGDFWLYCENKKPTAAIRLHGDRDVQEIRGLYNKEKTLDPLWEPVTSFLHQTDFNYTGNRFYKHLQDIMMKNANLDDPAVFQNLLNSIKSDPKQFGLISEKNKREFPELVAELAKEAAHGYDRQMNALLDDIETIPPTGREYQSRFGRFQDEYTTIPEEVKPYMNSDVQGRLVQVHKTAFMRNPLEYEFFPDDMKAIITPEEKKESWSRYVADDPYRFNDLISRYKKGEDADNISDIVASIPLKPIIIGWDDLINQNIQHVDGIPDFILKYFPKNYIGNKIIEDFKKYPCSTSRDGYDKLKRVQEKGLLTEEQISQAYSDFVSRETARGSIQNPISLVPKVYREAITSNMGEDSSVADGYYQQVITNASYFKTIRDPNIKNILITNPRYIDGVVRSFVKLKDKYPENEWNGYCEDLPFEIKPLLPDWVKDSVANFWLPYAQRNPAYLDRLDGIIRPLVENKLQTLPPPQASGNWYKRIRSYELV